VADRQRADVLQTASGLRAPRLARAAQRARRDPLHPDLPVGALPGQPRRLSRRNHAESQDMVKRHLLPLLCLACALPALAADRIVADGAFSADSDGLRERSADLGYVHPLPNLGRQASLGVRAGYWLLADNSDRIEFGTLKLDGQGRSGALD